MLASLKFSPPEVQAGDRESQESESASAEQGVEGPDELLPSGSVDVVFAVSSDSKEEANCSCGITTVL